MKKILKAMLLSASALLFVAAPATINVYAQDPAASPAPAADQCAEKDKLYADTIAPNVVSNAKGGTFERRTTAYNAAKEYLQKYSNCTGEGSAAILTYLKDKFIPNYEKEANAAKIAAAAEPVNACIKTDDFNCIVVKGRDYVKVDPDNLNVSLYMIRAGYQNQVKNKVGTYNADTIALAKQTLSKVDANNSTEANAFTPYTSKQEAQAWLNYVIGYLNNVNKQPKDASQYIYKSLQYNSSLKTWYYPYYLIGSAYLDEYTKAAEAFNKIKDDAAVSEEDKNKAAGMYKAYADRAIDAYARAYKAAKDDKTVNATVSGDLFATLTDLYKLRNKGEATGLNDTYVAGVVAKPMPDPTSTVTPVIEAEPTTATTTGTPVAITSKTNADAGAERTSGAVATSTAKTTTKAAAKTPAKPVAKKPAAKKKS